MDEINRIDAEDGEDGRGGRGQEREKSGMALAAGVAVWRNTGSGVSGLPTPSDEIAKGMRISAHAK